MSPRCASAAVWGSRWSSRFRLPEIRIDREALTTIVAHARRDAPNECCGLLVGRFDGEPVIADGSAFDVPHEGGPHVLEAIPCSNGATDPSRRYEISPIDYFAQIRRCRRINDQQFERFAVVGAYHSHPHGTPEPSDTDVSNAFRNFVFLIVGLGGAGMQLAAYALTGETLTPVPLRVVD